MSNSRWIDAKERMPEIGQKILGYTSFNSPGNKIIIAGTYSEWGLLAPGYGCDFTHWMPQPEPPWSELADETDPMVLAGYLENTGWTRFRTKRTDIRIYQKECGKFFQVTIPMNNALADYDHALREACKKAAECEGITTEQLCSRLQKGA